MPPEFQTLRRKFHDGLLGDFLTRDKNGVPSIADGSNRTSVAISKHLLDALGGGRSAGKGAGQKAGNSFETHCRRFIENGFSRLSHLRPGTWDVVRVTSRRGAALAEYEQYEHLARIVRMARESEALAASLGNDYTIAPDILVLRAPEPDRAINAPGELVDTTVATRSPLRQTVNSRPIIHASISCKWTLRSDRAQNARSEALNLIRNRKGRCPHIVALTAEPTPSRLASLALGTGDIDCVYHFALPELIESVAATGHDDSSQLLATMTEGKRLKDIADLLLDLAV